MLWQEDDPDASSLSSEVVDLAFRIEARSLPVDHARALSQAVREVLPWVGEAPATGLHLIHGATSGNGWMRPEDPGGIFYVSRRTRLTLRMPASRVAEAGALVGRTLDLDGYPVRIGQARPRPLQAMPVLLARHVVAQEGEDEPAFVARLAGELAEGGIRVRKLVCGRSHVLGGPEGPVQTRSVMIADLRPEDSLRLQEQGLGPGRHMGCGLFLPHKDIASLDKKRDE